MVLTEMNSPALKGGVMMPEDLILIAKVMSSDSIEEVLTKPRFSDWWHFMCLRFWKGYYTYALEGVKVHIKEGTSWPLVLDKNNSSGSEKGLHWTACVITGLVECGVPLKEVLLMPEGQAMWLYTTLAISKGADVDVLPSDLEEELKAIAKQNATAPQ